MPSQSINGIHSGAVTNASKNIASQLAMAMNPSSEEGCCLAQRSAWGLPPNRAGCEVPANAFSLTPPDNAMGSAKRLSQDTTQLHNRTGIQACAGRFVPVIP
jgi:hypothetical protein